MLALDAPVSGGDIGARDAKLSIMVGGEEEDFEAVRPILEVMGNNIVYQGTSRSRTAYENVQSNYDCFQYDWCYRSTSICGESRIGS